MKKVHTIFECGKYSVCKVVDDDPSELPRWFMQYGSRIIVEGSRPPIVTRFKMAIAEMKEMRNEY